MNSSFLGTKRITFRVRGMKAYDASLWNSAHLTLYLILIPIHDYLLLDLVRAKYSNLFETIVSLVSIWINIHLLVVNIGPFPCIFMNYQKKWRRPTQGHFPIGRTGSIFIQMLENEEVALHP